MEEAPTSTDTPLLVAETTTVARVLAIKEIEKLKENEKRDET